MLGSVLRAASIALTRVKLAVRALIVTALHAAMCSKVILLDIYMCRSSRERRGRCPMGMDRCTIFLSLSFYLEDTLVNLKLFYLHALTSPIA